MGEGEKRRSIVLLIYAFTGCLLYVPWPGTEPATLLHWDNILTELASQGPQ